MRVYIAGPMRGIPDWNFPAFDTAEQRWREAGYQPFSPAQIDRVLQYGPEEGESPSHLRHVVQMDIACILNADAIALLPGWEGSTGAAVETALAQFLGLPIYCAVTMERVYPTGLPWLGLEGSPVSPETSDLPRDPEWENMDVWHKAIANSERRYKRENQ